MFKKIIQNQIIRVVAVLVYLEGNGDSYTFSHWSLDHTVTVTSVSICYSSNTSTVTSIRSGLKRQAAACFSAVHSSITECGDMMLSAAIGCQIIPEYTSAV